MEEGGQRLYRAPRNAVGEPRRRDADRPAGSRGVPVLARLVWPSGAVLVPASALAYTWDRVLIEWHPNPQAQGTRKTWLPRSDVWMTLRLPA